MMRMWRHVNARLVELYQYMHLIFGTATYTRAPPSTHVQLTAQAVFHLLHVRRHQRATQSAESESDLALGDELFGGVIGNKDSADATYKCQQQIAELREAEAWRRAHSLLQECSQVDTLLQVTVDGGPNVLLSCILQDDQDLLQLLIQEGIDLNQSHCTLPLHLAASVGNLPIVKMLLDAGANPTMEAGMCHPKHHRPIKHVPSRFHFLETDIYVCDSDHKLALMYAIEKDHVDTARYLMEFCGAGALQNWLYQRYPLHYACSQGAARCVEYLVRIRPDDLNEVDEDGLTPLLHAVQWGHALVKFLVESGADVHAKTRRRRQGTLHLLYSSIENPLELYTTTKFLLGTGMEQDVNCVDMHGNSLLHDLTAQVNRVVSGFRPQPQEATTTSLSPFTYRCSSTETGTGNGTFIEEPSCKEDLKQKQFDEQVIATLDLLLSFNCDANIVNNSGVTALHKLLLSLDFVLSADSSSITLKTLPARQRYKVDLPVARRAMGVLLQHRANPNALTSAGRGPLIIMLQTLAGMDAALTARHSDGYLCCLSLLLESGAQPSLNLHTHLSVVAGMTKYAHGVLQERCARTQDAGSEVLQCVLTLLLRHGLNSNHSTHGRKAKYLECTSGNILLEVVKLAACIRQPADLLRVHAWVLSLLQGGADPDVEPYPSDPIICHSQGSIFLKPKGTQAVNQYMYDIQDFSQIFDGGYAEMLLLLFFNTMDHEALYQCMNTAKNLSRFDPNRAPSGRFLQLIHTLSSRPRSLRQVARVAIYKAMDRQLSQRVPELPLPKAMRDYLLNIE